MLWVVAPEVICRALGVADFSDAYALLTDLDGADCMAPHDLARAQFRILPDHPGTSLSGAERGG